MLCNKCNYNNPDNAKFCRECGSPLISEQPAAPEAQPVAEPADQVIQNTPISANESAEAQNTNGFAGAPVNTPEAQPAAPVIPHAEAYDPNNVAPSPLAQQEPGKGFAIASLICGILAIVCCGGMIQAVLAIVFAFVAKSKGYKGGLATAGIITAIVGIVLGIGTIIFSVITAAIQEANYHY